MKRLQKDLSRIQFTKSEFVELIKCAERSGGSPETERKQSVSGRFITRKKIIYRGLIEYTNYCKNDCYYCGIRK